jgi:predicted ATPase with chaperone activity
MLYTALSAAVYCIDANIIQVEVDCSGIKTDQDHFHTVGLPDAAVRESRDRVRAALKNCGYDIPPTHITINLAPADIKKEGSGFDLPLALGIVGAYGGLTKKERNFRLPFGRRVVPRRRRSRHSRNPAGRPRGTRIARVSPQVLRQPLEDGAVTIARAAMALTFPARFMLAAAMNPCPCGFRNDRTRECQCTTPIIQRYISKISGPVMDRIDIHIDVPAVNYKEMLH